MTQKTAAGRPGMDPELLYIECARCGSPVLWAPGKIGALLEHAGIDPLELDSSCILLTDGCSTCGEGEECHGRIFRVSSSALTALPITYGNA